MRHYRNCTECRLSRCRFYHRMETNAHGPNFPRARAQRQLRLRSGTRMKRFLAVLLMVTSISAATNEPPTFDEKTAERFAKLALACVGKQYPNKISHVLNSDADVAPPRKLTPAFTDATTGIRQCTDTGSL